MKRMKPERNASLVRKTAETEVKLSLNLDGTGQISLRTGVGFFEHMLTLLAHHGKMDLTVEASGDLQVDAHHLVEDVGLVLGEAFGRALGDKAGLARYGMALLPMDEALVMVALDLSGRPHLSIDLPLPAEKLGNFETELVQEFFRAFVSKALITLHIKLLAGTNTHHIIEAAFKGVGRALAAAKASDSAGGGIPSTKGVL